MIRRFAPMLALAGITAAAAMLAVSPAFAHARLKSSTPAAGEAITASPARVEITFTQEIQKIAGEYGITVVKDRGLDVTAGPTVVDDADRTKMSVPLQPGLANGRYVVHWKNTSDEDGDPAEGAFSFYLNYTPNAVDLASDAQLAALGEEPTPTPGASGTAATGATPATTPGTGATSAAPSAEATGAVITAATPSASPTATATDDGGGSDTTQYVIIAIAIAIIVVVAFGGWRWFGGRK